MKHLILLLFLFLLSSCQDNGIEIEAPLEINQVPELPQITDLENYESQVQDQFKKQYEYIKMFDKDRNDKYAFSVAKLGKVFQAYNKFPQAIDCYLIALSIDSDNYEWMYLLASVYKYTGFNELSLEHYQKSLKAHESLPTKLSLAEIYSQKNELELAKNYFQQILAKEPHHHRALYGLAIINRAQNEPQKAIEKLLKIIKAQPNVYNVNYQLGQLYVQNSQIDLAQKYLDKVLETQESKVEINYIDPFLKEVSDLKINSQHLVKLGLQSIHNKRYNQAIRYLEKGMNANDNRTDIKYNLAIAYFKSGQVQKAQSLAETILTQEPDHELSQVMLAKIEAFNKQLNN